MPPKTEQAAPPQAKPVQAADDAPEPQPAPEAVAEVGQVEVPVEPAAPEPEPTYSQTQLAEAVENARREAQGKTRKEFATWRQQYEGEQRDSATFQRLEAQRTSEDPEQRDIFTREIANPDLRQSYDRGQHRHSDLPPEVMEKVGIKAMADAIGPFIAELQDLPELKGLPRDERGLIPLDVQPNNAAEHGLALTKLAIQKGAEKLAAKMTEKAVEDAKKAERSRVLAEVGVEPEQIEGTPTAGPTLIRKQYADGEIDTPTYNARMVAAGATP